MSCWALVSPGLFSTLATLLPASLLIKVDFPLFGIPTTSTRGISPL